MLHKSKMKLLFYSENNFLIFYFFFFARFIVSCKIAVKFLLLFSKIFVAITIQIFMNFLQNNYLCNLSLTFFI